MIIRCPHCRFERDVPEGGLRPGKAYKVTCPRCSSVFQFAMPEQEEFAIEPEETGIPLERTQEEARQDVLPEQTMYAGVAESEQPAEDEGLRADASADAASAAEKKPELSAAAPRLPSEQDGDDPLPPGAVIPAFDKEEPKSEPEQEQGKVEVPQEESRPESIWDRLMPGSGQATEPEEEGDGILHREDGRPDGAPWESPEYYGFWGSFSRTLLGVLFHAPDFFRHVKCQFSVIRPILFYVLLSLFQMLCARLWSIKALREISATATDPQTIAMAEQLMQHMNMPLMLLITPFFSIFQAVILAGIYHLMIRMVQPDRADFATTLRVVCYSAAPLVLCLVPMFGSMVATLWSVVTVFVGCRYALRLSWLRTVLALLPLYILELALISQIPALMAV